jgi:hypothetical protein
MSELEKKIDEALATKVKTKDSRFSYEERRAGLAGLRKMYQYVAVVEGAEKDLHVPYTDATKDEVENKLRADAKRRGNTVEWPDGTREWYVLEAVFNPEDGSGQHWKGNNVLGEFVCYKQPPSGTRERIVIKRGWFPWQRFED